MKIKYLISILLLMVSCSYDNETEDQIVIPTTINLNVKDFEYEKQSRTSFEITEDGARFTWAANDTVGIFPDKGFQGYFPMLEGAGTKKASFTGGGWGLKSSSNYAAYYPFIKSMDVDKTAIPVNYEGQIQKGDGSLEHLGKYDYMAAVAKTPEQGMVNFDFEHLGCLVQLSCSNISERWGTIRDLELFCEEPVFVTKGSFDLTAKVPQFVAGSDKKRNFTLKLEQFDCFMHSRGTFSFMGAPVDLTQKKVTVRLRINDRVYVGSFIGKKWEAGHAYYVPVKMEKFVEEQWVDLGLPSGLLWASHNVGASSSTDSGDYFSWAELTPKSQYTPDNTLSYGKLMESSISGNTEYDVAAVSWGEGARMPTTAEFRELKNNTNAQWVNRNGVDGLLLTGPNGGGIFFPAAGENYNSSVELFGKYGSYWSASPSIDDNDLAWKFYFDDNLDYWLFDIHHTEALRYEGMPIRPVKGNIAFQPKVTTEYYCDTNYTSAEVSMSFSNIPKYTECGIEYALVEGDSIVKESVQRRCVAFNGDAQYSMQLTNLLENRTYSYRAYAMYEDQIVYGKRRKFTTRKRADLWIDLGLPSGTKWASHNIGADRPEDYGDYFAWGEKSPKSSYTEENSKTYGQYLLDIYNDRKYDVAVTEWGNGARMPTMREVMELEQYCISEWIYYFGVRGLSMKGPNGNSIFIPASGCWQMYNISREGKQVCFWSGGSEEHRTTMAYSFCYLDVFCNPSEHADCWTNRAWGLNVRPVKD